MREDKKLEERISLLEIEMKGWRCKQEFITDWIKKKFITDLEELHTVNDRIKKYTKELESSYEKIVQYRKNLAFLKKSNEELQQLLKKTKSL